MRAWVGFNLANCVANCEVVTTKPEVSNNIYFGQSKLSMFFVIHCNLFNI